LGVGRIATSPTETDETRSDSQIVEIIGRNWLVGELYRSGVEVARPERDHGIDLIAFVDLDESGRFVGRPIQMKASTKKMFGVWRRLEKFPDLLLAYVWNLTSPSDSVCYCLTYAEAKAIADKMGWIETASWTKGGSYITNAPSARLLSLLEPFRMVHAADWPAKIRG
jgi:hypothetical protein